jgi:hypothetical protein
MGKFMEARTMPEISPSVFSILAAQLTHDMPAMAKAAFCMNCSS